MGTEIDGVNGIIKNTTSDGDVTIKGNDGGSEISALVFDMSDAGTANFNNKVGIVNAHDLGTGLHIKTADSGAGVNVNADELVIEGSGNAGMSILAGASSKANIFLGDSGSSAIGNISYDHSDNSLGIGVNGAENFKILSTGAATITTADNTAQLTLTSTDTDANSGPRLDFIRNPGEAGANADFLSAILHRGYNDATELTTFAEINVQIVDAANGGEDGRFYINTMVAGTAATSRMELTPTETVFNEGGANLDFRVESDGVDKMLFVNGGTNSVSIGGEATPLGRLHVFTADSSSGAHANADEFVIEGSAYSGMTIASGNSSHGTIAFADSGDELAGRIVYNHSTNALSFGAAGVGTQWSINSDGNLLPGNSTGQGIHLGVTSAGAANLLDDYEEGTWTATNTGGFAGDPTATCHYTKIGRVVYIASTFNFPSANFLAENIIITGLPFATATDGDATADATLRAKMFGFVQRTDVPAEAVVFWSADTAGATTITLRFMGDNASTGQVQGVAASSVTPNFTISGFYFTDS